MSSPAADRADLAFAIKLAEDAGASTLAWFQSATLAVEHKGDGSPVTAADLAAEARVRERLAATHPGDGIIGEEDDDLEGSTGRRWVVDPIDGTRAFICGRPVFGTLIGLVRDGVPLAGFIDMPMLDECYVAVGGAATMNRAPIRTSRVTELSCARIATTSPEALKPDSLDAFNRLSAASATSTYGGDCHNYALLAAGHVDIVLEDGLATHDIMGVVEVIRAAGGIVTDKTGAAVTMQGTDSLLAASTPELHAAAFALPGKSG